MRPQQTRTVALVLFLAPVLGVGVTSVVADTPVPKGQDPEARAWLDAVALAYRELPAYSDQGEFAFKATVSGMPTAIKVPLHVAFARPNKLSLDTGVGRIVSDGTTLTSVVNALKTYRQDPAPAAISFDTVFTGGPVSSAIFGGPSMPMMQVLLGLLLGRDGVKAVTDLGDSLTIDGERALDGVSCRVLKVASRDGPAYLLWTDAQTKQIHAIDLVPDSKTLGEVFPAGQTVTLDLMRWSAGPISTKAPADETFVFTPPRSFARIEDLALAPTRNDDEAPRYKVQSLVGKTSPDFTLTVLDGPETTKTVSRADLAGKVVVIDFWATWCPPCLAELPEIQALIDTFAKDKKEVVVVALSQDDDPRDPVEVRKLIVKTLEEKKIVLNAPPFGRVALDPSNTVGEAFQVEGYPTIVILDGKGVVRSAHVGFGPEVGKTLRAEVDALLEGKPIPREKPEPAK